jgi:hypothetical protein
MPKYFVTYRVWSDFQTVIESDDEESVREKFLNEGWHEDESDFIMSDLDYDSIDIMETE